MKAGIDIGGSFVKFAFANDKKIETEKVFIKDYIDSKDIDSFFESILKILKKRNITDLGIAVAGLVNKNKGWVEVSPNIPLIEKFPIVDFFQKKLKADVKIENDANAAALGEYTFGAGKNSSILVTITLGTGLGSGCVINGKLLSGSNGVAMEFGHTTVQKDGLRCHCGRNGCLEAYVSSYGLERTYFLLADKHLSSSEIINLANKGDEKALETFEIFNDYLSTGLMNIVHTFNPDRILLSGGIVEYYPVIVKMAYSKLKEKAFPISLENLTLDLAALGEFSGAYGALALTLE